jgi:hypothetical protein
MTARLAVMRWCAIRSGKMSLKAARKKAGVPKEPA